LVGSTFEGAGTRAENPQSRWKGSGGGGGKREGEICWKNRVSVFKINVKSLLRPAGEKKRKKTYDLRQSLKRGTSRKERNKLVRNGAKNEKR